MDHCSDVIWQLELLRLAGFLRGVCVSEGWEWARELWQLTWEDEGRIQSLLGKKVLTWLFYAPQDRGLPGKLEPVSPVSPAHPDAELDLLPTRLSKEELIQNMDRVDREITMVEQQISKLKKKQVRGCGLEGSTHPHFCVLPYTPSWPSHGHRGEVAAPVPSGCSVSVLPVVTWAVAAVPAVWSW